MHLPTTVASTLDNAFVTSLDIHKPEFLAKLYAKFGNQWITFIDQLKAMGFMTPVAQEDYSHFEDDYFVETFHALAGVASPATGASMDITLDTSDLDASNRFFPQVKDLVRFSNEMVGLVKAIDVTTPTAPILTINPVNVDDDLPAVIEGEEITVISNAHSEGSGQPNSRLPKTNQVSFNLQLIKEKLSATGTEMTNQLWVNSYTESGQPISNYLDLAKISAEYRMKLWMASALLYGRKSSAGQNVDANGRDIRTTEGLIPFITRVGQDVSYTPGLFSVQKFDEISGLLEKQNAPSSIWVGGGFNFLNEKDNVLQSYFGDNNIPQFKQSVVNSVFGGNIELEASVCYQYLYKAQRGFAFSKIGLFSHTKSGNASGFKDSSTALFLPMAKKSVNTGSMSETLPMFGMRYKQLGKHNRMLQVWKTGAAGENPAEYTNDEDVQNLEYRSHIGFHGVAGNQFLRLHA